MKNEYRINTKWSLEGKPAYIYDVIMKLMEELEESLKVPMMKESKSDEEVRKILDNPEGITIKELQIINAWSLNRKLRREVRNKLDWAYRELSTKLNRLITARNGMANRSKEKNDNIDDENRKLKNTINSQYEVIKGVVEDYEKEEKRLGLSESESEKNLLKNKRKLLTYIRKVYSGVLNEIVENLFSMATDDTERAKIFPFEEQEGFKSKIGDLQNSIELITEKNKQKKIDQQKELEKEAISLKQLKDTLNISFPNLIDSENKINEEVQKSIVENLTELREVQKQAGKENEVIKKVIKDLKDLIKNEVDNKISQRGLDHAETRLCLNKVVDGIEKGIIVELEKAISLRSSNEGIEYQNQQIQLPKK